MAIRLLRVIRVPSLLRRAYPRFPAFSLLESLAAVTILSIAAAATFMTFGWVIQSNAMPLELRADAVLRAVAQETRQQQRYLDETFERGGLSVERRIVDLPDSKNCFVLHLSALDPRGKTLAVYEELACF